MPGCLLQVSVDKKAAAEQIKGLYRLFEAKDCTMVEVSCGCHFLRSPSGISRVARAMCPAILLQVRWSAPLRGEVHEQLFQ